MIADDVRDVRRFLDARWFAHPHGNAPESARKFAAVVGRSTFLMYMTMSC